MLEILSELKTIFFCSLLSIKEIGIFYSNDASSPAITFSDNNLGISILVLKDLFRFSYTYFHNFYLLHRKNKNNISLISSSTSNEDLMDIATLVLLVVKGDIHSVINCRKEMLMNKLITYENEIYVTNLLIRKNSKSPSLWRHRRFCIEYICQDNNSLLFDQSIDIKKELDLCEIVAEQSAKNYYAWVHRLWTIQICFKTINITNKLKLASFLAEEFSFIDKWLSSHISDHSAVNHQVQLMNMVLTNTLSGEDIIDDIPLEISNNLILSKIRFNSSNEYLNDEVDLNNNMKSDLICKWYLEYVGDVIIINSHIKLLLQRLLWLECLLFYRNGGCESLWLLRRTLFSFYLNYVITINNNLDIIKSSLEYEKKFIEKINDNNISNIQYRGSYYHFIIMDCKKVFKLNGLLTIDIILKDVDINFLSVVSNNSKFIKQL